MIRKRIFESIKCRIRQYAPEVKHIDLWNMNVEFIEQDTAWERPAVFVEFGDITWKPLKEIDMYRGNPSVVRLHIVTDWNGEDSNDDAFRVCDAVSGAVAGLQGAGFNGFELYSTATNHNHEEIVETIDEFTIRMTRELRRNSVLD